MKKLSSRSVNRILVISLRLRIVNIYKHSWRVGSKSMRRIGSRLGKNNNAVIIGRRIGLRGAVTFIIHRNPR